MKKPTSRRDIADLYQWINQMIEKVANDKNKSLQSYFNDLQVIYVATISELIR